MKKNYKTIGGIILGVIIVAVLFFKYSSGGSNELKSKDEEIFVDQSEDDSKTLKDKSSSADKDKSKTSSKDQKIVVEIKGEVKNPNIYWLSEENIIDDLIEKAGGLTDQADVTSINRAKKLTNHEAIIVPSKDKSKGNVGASSANALSNSSNNLININTATEAELDSLPGVGPAKAKSIIEYREKSGAFTSIEDIKNVKGIGESFFEKLKDKITI